MVSHILDNYTNGLLLLEDINLYIYDYMPQDIVGKILSQRHKGLDIIMHFHSLGAVQKKIWRHIDVIRLHHTQDCAIDNRDKFKDKYELFCIAENIVDAQFQQGNQYFNVEIKLDHNTINGAFTNRERDKAIDDYISLHYTQKVLPYLNRVDRTGERKFTAATAFEAEFTRIIRAYFPSDN
jgi:hypothetical protein